jgi:arylsulfatase A-like enzyme
MRASSRATLLVALGATILGCGRPAPSQPGLPPANVLLLVVDCLRADRVGAQTRYHRAVAPRLEALADAGTRFTRAFAQSSWTRPSVPTLLTGLYPSEHGLGAFLQEGDQVTGGSLSPAAVTVAEAMRALGYTTALFAQQNQLAPKFGLAQGFDVYDHKASRAAHIHEEFLSWLDSDMPAAGGGAGSPAPSGGDDSLAPSASAADSREKRPFFAYLHYLELHWPYCAPPATRGVFTAGYQGRPLCADWRRLRDEIRSGAVTLTVEEIEAMRGQYDEELLALDGEIGSLFDRLRERGLWDDTLIVVTSDHGEEFFEHGGMAHGTSLFDELIHVPLVLKPPASWAAAPGTVNALVEHRDLLPTFIEAAGEQPATTGDRRSLRQLLLGSGGEREFVVAELGSTIAVRTAEHKLIVERSGGERRLFDLARDPGELHDVAAENPATVQRLESHLRRWRAALAPIPAGAETLDDETIEGLRALGYL